MAREVHNSLLHMLRKFGDAAVLSVFALLYDLSVVILRRVRRA
jgi:hypothetical protein